MGTILILANSSGGLYDFRNELLLALLKEHRVVVSLPDDVKAKELSEEGCELVHTPINRHGMRPTEDAKLFFAYRGLLRHLRPDLVLTYTVKPDIYGGFASRLMKLPYLTTITGLGGGFEGSGALRKLLTVMYRVGLKKSECVFFQNKENREVFRSFGIRGKKDRLVSGSGVNLEKHTLEPFPMGDKTVFLFAGRVMEKKGILEYLEAAVRLKRDDVEFAVMGYCDEDYQELLDEYEEKGIISQWGFQTQVHSWFARADAVVVPSWHEGMNNVILEAAATGRPVIASDISGCREGFEDGVTGFGFPAKDAGELTGALERFLSLTKEERAEMGRAARRKMEREFDRSAVTGAYMEEINEALGHSKE